MATGAEYFFGAGTLWGFPNAGNLGTAPSPRKFGVLQGVDLQISGDFKELYGNKQFPVDVARGKIKVTGKAKYGTVDGKQLNDIFYGQTSITGRKIVVEDESQTVAAASATVTHSANFIEDWGVIDGANGVQMDYINTPTLADQYSQAAGVYTFAASMNGVVVLISYTYTDTSGHTFSVTNQAMGYAPQFQILLHEVYKGVVTDQLWYSCMSGKIAWQTKNEDYVIPEIDIQMFADATGRVFDMWTSN